MNNEKFIQKYFPNAHIVIGKSNWSDSNYVDLLTDAFVKDINGPASSIHGPKIKKIVDCSITTSTAERWDQARAIVRRSSLLSRYVSIKKLENTKFNQLNTGAYQLILPAGYCKEKFYNSDDSLAESFINLYAKHLPRLIKLGAKASGFKNSNFLSGHLVCTHLNKLSTQFKLCPNNGTTSVYNTTHLTVSPFGTEHVKFEIKGHAQMTKHTHRLYTCTQQLYDAIMSLFGYVTWADITSTSRQNLSTANIIIRLNPNKVHVEKLIMTDTSKTPIRPVIKDALDIFNCIDLLKKENDTIMQSISIKRDGAIKLNAEILELRNKSEKILTQLEVLDKAKLIMEKIKL